MASYYSRPSYPVFAGTRRQVGGGVFGSIARSFLPFMKRAAVPMLKEVGKSALELGTNVAFDALQGENIGESLKARGKQSAMNLLDDLVSSKRVGKRRKRKRTQVGSGRVTKQTSRRRVRRKASAARKPKKNSRKRRRKSKSSTASKRKRISYI